MSLESCEFEKSLYLHISTFWWRFETFSCSPCSPLFTHEPFKDSFAFPGSGTIWCKAQEGALPCCSFFQPPVFIQGPLQILDILTIFLKACLLVHLSLFSSRVKMLLIRRKLAWESVSNTGKTCSSCCPSLRSVSRELILYRRACSHSSRELIRGELAPLIVSPLLLWSWSSASRVTPSTSSAPHSHLRRFY